jgi:hypothetical protein
MCSGQGAHLCRGLLKVVVGLNHNAALALHEFLQAGPRFKAEREMGERRERGAKGESVIQGRERSCSRTHRHFAAVKRGLLRLGLLLLPLHLPLVLLELACICRARGRRVPSG